MRPVSATADRAPSTSHPATIAMFVALAGAGFRRYATYRQAMVAAMFTNSVFGFLRCYAILATLAGAGGAVAGYSAGRMATFVWVGQGLIGTVLLWAPPEIAERIRTGEIVSDLLRPVALIWRELASDIGRASYGAMTRLFVPIAVGAACFDLYVPRRLATYPLFAVSLLLAVVVCFGCRYLVNLTAFWLLDTRGPQVGWGLCTTVLTGLTVPLTFFPDWASIALRYGTPPPSIMQLPLDLLVERGSVADQLRCLATQAGWAVALLVACVLVQRRAERRLVVQGG